MNAVILAAGRGVRMKSALPKCAVLLNGKPMLNHIIETLKKIEIENIYVVVGYKKEEIIKIIPKGILCITQKEQLGTGDAVKSCKDVMKDLKGDTLILPGDVPLIGEYMLKDLINKHQKEENDMTILTMITDNPFGYGRIVRDNNFEVSKIVEEKDLDDEDRVILEVNTGIYCVNNQVLFKNIDKLHNFNNKQEYYLTDLVEILAKDYRVKTMSVKYHYQLTGVNDLETLKKLGEWAI
ncbi:MAG: NTP transferase domain-containing protein [Bacilli bacterium]|nr:NTP transferase domain-containing protein [Bacilli bacterium]